MRYAKIKQYRSTTTQYNKAKTVLYQGIDGSLLFQQLFLIDSSTLPDYLKNGFDFLINFKDKSLVKKEMAFNPETFNYFLNGMIDKGMITIK